MSVDDRKEQLEADFKEVMTYINAKNSPYKVARYGDVLKRAVNVLRPTDEIFRYIAQREAAKR